jgi:hypothetical protein
MATQECHLRTQDAPPPTTAPPAIVGESTAPVIPTAPPATTTATTTTTTAGDNVIEVDPSIDGGDEGYEADGRSDASTSVASGVRDYVFENNRRYHKFKEGRYLIPNDNQEQEREDMKHVLVLNLCGGKLHFAPLQNPKRILDLGTGTGIWCIDSASSLVPPPGGLGVGKRLTVFHGGRRVSGCRDHLWH